MSERLADHIAGGTISGPDGTYWNLQRDDAENIIDALLPHLTAQDVPHLIRQAKAEAWEVGYDRALRSHCDALDLDGQCDVEDPNHYAEEATDDHA